MRTRRTLILSFALLASTALHAVTKTWVGGASGLWHVAGNWSPSGTPASADIITIAGGAVQYVPGGDLTVASGASLTMGSGGSFVQTGGIAWMWINGSLVLQSGGVFDTGTAGAFNIGSSGSVILNSGSTFLRRSNNLVVDSHWTFNGGTVDIGMREFQFNTPVNFNGVLYAGILAPQNTAGILNVTGGHLYLRNPANESFWRPGTAHVNFTQNSTCVVSITNCAPSAVYSRYFSGATPRMTYDGAAVASGDFATLFVAEASSSLPGGADIYLIPQEAAGAATFVDNSCVKSNLTTTTATVYGTVADPGSPAATVFACYGTANGAAIFANWQNKVTLGAATANTPFSYAATLAPNTLYYYRMAATNTSGVAFATPSPAFLMTGAVGVDAPSSVPENQPTPVSIVISRPASNNCTSVALPVPFTLGGTAALGTHYTLSTASPATIPASASSVTVALTPKADWSSSTERTVTLTVGESPSYLVSASNSVSILLTNAILPSAPTNAFLGAVSESSANPANWSLGVVPAAEHIIVFSPEYAQRQLDWVVGTTTTVAGWRQPYAFPQADYRVLFHTTPGAPLTVTGDCLLNGGYWIHEGPAATPTTAVAVNIGGNLTIGSGAQINAGNGIVNQVNGATRGYYLAGPGYFPTTGTAGTGSSYGGEGSTNDVTYGSILNPMSYGSSGRGDNANFAGGGLLVLNVAGATTLNGGLLAKGFGYTGTGRGGSTGGSVNLTTASLLGNGTISVDGGWDSTRGSGSGGRIRVKLTGPTASFSDFLGAMTAYGSPGIPGSAAGTIALQTAADSAVAARVVVDNNQFSDATNAPYRAMCTHLPPKTQTDPSLAGTTWVLRNYASVRLTRDTQIAALVVEGTTPRIFTETCTLTTQSFVVNGATKPTGTYTAAELPGLLHGSGAVVVAGGGTVCILR